MALNSQEIKNIEKSPLLSVDDNFYYPMFRQRYGAFFITKNNFLVIPANKPNRLSGSGGSCLLSAPVSF